MKYCRFGTQERRLWQQNQAQAPVNKLKYTYITSPKKDTEQRQREYKGVFEGRAHRERKEEGMILKHL